MATKVYGGVHLSDYEFRVIAVFLRNVVSGFYKGNNLPYEVKCIIGDIDMHLHEEYQEPMPLNFYDGKKKFTIYEHRYIYYKSILPRGTDDISICRYSKKRVSEKYEVHHIDKDRGNNSIFNLCELHQHVHQSLAHRYTEEQNIDLIVETLKRIKERDLYVLDSETLILFPKPKKGAN